MNRLSIKARIVSGFLLIVMLVILGVTPVVISGMNRLVDTAEQRELAGLARTFSVRLGAEERLATALATMVAELPTLNRYLANEDREGLNGELQSAFQKLKSQFGLRQFQYHTPPAISWLRVHKPEKFGDDLTGFRKTLVEANARQSAVNGLEGGVAGLGIRGVAPVFIDSEHWGTVEMGFSLNEAFFQSFVDETGADIGMYLLQPDGRFQTYKSTYSEQSLIPQDLAKKIMDGEPQSFISELNGTPVTAYGMAAVDFSGTPIGIYEIVLDRSEYLASLSRSKLLSGGIIGGIALIAVLIALVIVSSITRPLKHMNDAMAAVAEGDGDLTRRLPIEGRNELTEVADNFNRFISNLESVISRLHAVIEKVSVSSTALLESSRSSLDIADRQRAETTDVAAAMNQMSATAREVAKSAEATANMTSAADDNATEGKVVVSNTISSIKSLSEDVHQTTQVVTEVSRHSTEINSILEVIQSIADQTNLLALNAAIEAARAGESGRGFAVVADEVRALAARTHQSTDEINSMIVELNNGTDKTVQIIDKSWKRAESTVNDAEKAGAMLQKITAEMDQIRDMTAQIASASEEQTSVSEMINQRIDSISLGADQNLEAAQNMLRETGVIEAELKQLTAAVARFKVN